MGCRRTPCTGRRPPCARRRPSTRAGRSSTRRRGCPARRRTRPPGRARRRGRAAPGRARPTATTARARPAPRATRPMSACSPTPGAVLMTPERVGPDHPQPVGAHGRRVPPARGRGPSASSLSEKPAETTSRARTPARAASSTTPSTSPAGTATTASSGGWSRSARVRTARMERTTPPSGDGVTTPRSRRPRWRDVAPPRCPRGPRRPPPRPTRAPASGAARRRGQWSRSAIAARPAAVGPQVEREVDLAERRLAAHVEARAGEDAQHRAVVGQHLGVEAADRLVGGDIGELLEQPRRRAAAVELLRHREGDLRRARLAAAGRIPRRRRSGRRGRRPGPRGRRRRPRRSRAPTPSERPNRGSAGTGSRATGPS